MQCRLLTCLFALALVASPCLSLPVDGSDDLGLKPTNADPNTQHSDSSKDDYDNVQSVYKEAITEDGTLMAHQHPQTGSLVQADEAITEDVQQDVNNAKLNPDQGKAKLAEDSELSALKVTQEQHDGQFPLNNGDGTGFAKYKSSEETMAGVPVVDSEKKNLFGVPSAPIVLSRPEELHPMEKETPSVGALPCDADRHIVVSVAAATLVHPTDLAPTLPVRYGCSATDVSREKPSPEISWSNVSEDVFEFSLQMIQMGDNCVGSGPDFGRIHWHVEGIKAAANVTFREGASHDKRLLHGGVEQPNQWLEEYYSGPCPPDGTQACYRFKLLARRANGWCQCGFQDVLFNRPEKPVNQPWVYVNKTIAGPGQ